MVLKRQATTPPDPSGSPWPVAGSGAAVPLKAGNGEQKKARAWVSTLWPLVDVARYGPTLSVLGRSNSYPRTTREISVFIGPILFVT